MKKHVYIVEHEPNVQQVMQHFLEKAGYVTSCFHDGGSLLQNLERVPADLVVLEANMPFEDNLSLCQSVRRLSTVPLIVVSSKNELADKLQSLQAGADDYMTKPFSPLELTARVKSLLRRVDLDLSVNKQATVLDFTPNEQVMGNVRLNEDTMQCTCGDQLVPLTAMEFSMLLYMLKHQHRAIARDELLEKVWKFEANIATRATDDVAKRIRKKMKMAGANVYLETVWGFGFIMTHLNQA